jgi:hypothetical protein
MTREMLQSRNGVLNNSVKEYLEAAEANADRRSGRPFGDYRH